MGRLTKICAVACCPSPQAASYHRFPKVGDIRQQAWVDACKRLDTLNVLTARICSEHFAPDDFERDLQNELLNLPTRRILKSTAIPHLKLLPENFGMPQANGENKKGAKKSPSIRIGEVRTIDNLSFDAEPSSKRVRKPKKFFDDYVSGHGLDLEEEPEPDRSNHSGRIRKRKQFDYGSDIPYNQREPIVVLTPLEMSPEKPKKESLGQSASPKKLVSPKQSVHPKPFVSPKQSVNPKQFASPKQFVSPKQPVNQSVPEIDIMGGPGSRSVGIQVKFPYGSNQTIIQWEIESLKKRVASLEAVIKINQKLNE